MADLQSINAILEVQELEEQGKVGDGSWVVLIERNLRDLDFRGIDFRN